MQRNLYFENIAFTVHAVSGDTASAVVPSVVLTYPLAVFIGALACWLTLPIMGLRPGWLSLATAMEKGLKSDAKTLSEMADLLGGLSGDLQALLTAGRGCRRLLKVQVAEDRPPAVVHKGPLGGGAGAVGPGRASQHVRQQVRLEGTGLKRSRAAYEKLTTTIVRSRAALAWLQHSLESPSFDETVQRCWLSTHVPNIVDVFRFAPCSSRGDVVRRASEFRLAAAHDVRTMMTTYEPIITETLACTSELQKLSDAVEKLMDGLRVGWTDILHCPKFQSHSSLSVFAVDSFFVALGRGFAPLSL